MAAADDTARGTGYTQTAWPERRVLCVGARWGSTWRGATWIGPCRRVVRPDCVWCAAYDQGAIGDWGALHLLVLSRHGCRSGGRRGHAAFVLAEAQRAAPRDCSARTTRLHSRSWSWWPDRVRLGCGSPCWRHLLAGAGGFALTGLGLANLFPVTIARAGLLAGSSGVALTSTLGYTGFLLGPPVIGFLACASGLRIGLTTLSALAPTAAVIAYFPPPPPPPPYPGTQMPARPFDDHGQKWGRYRGWRQIRKRGANPAPDHQGDDPAELDAQSNGRSRHARGKVGTQNSV